MRALKFLAAWGLYFLGDLLCRAGDGFFAAYQWCMAKSEELDEGWVWEEWDQ